MCVYSKARSCPHSQNKTHFIPNRTPRNARVFSSAISQILRLRLRLRPCLAPPPRWSAARNTARWGSSSLPLGRPTGGKKAKGQIRSLAGLRRYKIYKVIGCENCNKYSPTFQNEWALFMFFKYNSIVRSFFVFFLGFSDSIIYFLRLNVKAFCFVKVFWVVFQISFVHIWSVRRSFKFRPFCNQLCFLVPQLTFRIKP